MDGQVQREESELPPYRLNQGTFTLKLVYPKSKSGMICYKTLLGFRDLGMLNGKTSSMNVSFE